MNDIFPPPLPPPPQPERKVWPIVLIAAAAVIVVFAVLAALAVPTFKRVQAQARELRGKRDAATQAPGPLTPEQRQRLLAFGEDMAAKLTHGDSEGLREIFDADLLAERVFSKMGSSAFANGARKGFVESVAEKKGGMFSLMLGQKVNCLRTRERDGFPAVLLRCLPADGGVSYVDAIVVPKDGGFRLVDAFNYIFGDYISAEARNAMVPMMPATDGISLEALFGVPKVDKDATNRVLAIATAFQQGQHEKVLTLYNQLTPDLQHARPFYIIRLQSLMGLQADPAHEKEYLEALENAPAVLGKDSATDLLMLDKQIINHDFAGAINSLAKVDALVGGDPYMTVLQGTMKIKMNDVSGADELRSKAEKEEPDLLALIDLRLLIHAAREDFGALVKELRAFKTSHGVVLDRDTLSEPEYAGFLRSKEFSQWLRENGK